MGAQVVQKFAGYNLKYAVAIEATVEPVVAGRASDVYKNMIA